jgi:hypothetical protein
MSRFLTLHSQSTNPSFGLKPAGAATKWSLALAALLITTPALSTSLESASPEQKRAAQKMFEAGDGLYENGQFDQAAQAFRASYELVASPNSRLMIARSLRELKRYDEAFREYVATVKDAEQSVGRYPDTLKAAQAEADALNEQLSYIVIDSAPSGTEVRINGKAVTFTAGERLAVVESKVDLEVRLPDGKVRHETFDLKKQETHHVTPSAEKQAEALPEAAPAKAAATAAPYEARPSNGLRTAAYVAGGVGVAGLVTFGVFGALDHSIYSDLQSKCAAGCAAGNSSQIDKGRMYQSVANIGLGVAAIGAAAAVTLLIVAPAHSERPVALQVGPGSVVLRGGF